MKIGQIIIVEEDAYMKYYPFTVMHPVWEMRVGIHKIFEKYAPIFPDADIIFYSKRKEITESFYARCGYKNQDLSRKNTLVALAGFLPDAETLAEASDFEAGMPQDGSDTSFVIRNPIDEKPVALFMRAESVIHSDNTDIPFFKKIIEDFGTVFKGITPKNKEIYVSSIYDAVYYNAGAVENDVKLSDFDIPKVKPENFPHVAFKNADKIYVSESAEIDPFCFIDASAGPVVIDDGAKISAGSMLAGPCFIGKRTLIRCGAKIYPNTSIGEVCKIGGEVEDSIIQGFTNKQHDGFLGHSFLSEWVNLGAGTNNSDLKNTYGKVSTLVEGFRYPTQKQFLGVFIGDHSKTGIDTKFLTGSVVGISSSVVTGGYTDKSTPSFSFGGEETSPVYDISKAIMTARRVKARRDETLLPEEEVLMRIEFEHAKHLRELKRTVSF